MRSLFRWTLAVLFAVVAFNAQAQDSAATAAAPVGPGGACRDYPCKILVDWGSGQTAASYPSDRRYGQAADFEPTIKFVFGDIKLRIVDGGDVMVMTLRPMMKNAMCDAMAGTNTDMSCQTVDEVQVQFNSLMPGVKAPGTVRVTNRCGAGDQRMSVTQMANFTANFVAYQLASDKKGMKRPTAKC